MQIEQVRLLTLKTAWMMDTVGKKAAQTEIAAIKVMAARVATDVIDRAIQLFGGAGVTDDWPLASMYAHARTLHLVDGPDEVHMRQIARRELGKYAHLRPAGLLRRRSREDPRRLRPRQPPPARRRPPRLAGGGDRAPRLRLAVAVGAHQRPGARPDARPHVRGGAHQEDQARHERAGAARPEPGPPGQVVGDARRALGRPGAPRVRARHRAPGRASRRSASSAATGRRSSTRRCR